MKKWLVSHAEREGAVVARTTGVIEGAVLGARAGKGKTKVKQY